jgi:hypothetical protein
MKTKAVLTIAILGLLMAAPAIAAPDASTKTDAVAAAKVGAKAAPASQPAGDVPTDPKVPKDAGEALDTGKGVVADAKAKQWFAMSAGIIWLLMFLFKTGRKKLDFMKGIPKRVLWIVLPLLSVAAMLLAKFQGDLSWSAAVGVLTSGPAVAFLNDFVKRGLLNKEPTPMKG